ncbi:helix-turn-helix domain-containing protein [Limnohabitans sp. WS1]|uniref:helix-turn-helix domain-containing protein n=1 Tax=Limnohabitans sp. WS1 TaxID=1100726 RepID=UPI000D397123|nr:helix-turn-helix domain-containing protein [Limnohabitans sp. WS1]PUE15495.1 hypothetical protein B9Z48_11565 [Limnohabitans sp. WS1]
MSNTALMAVWRIEVRPAAKKLVLVYFSDRMSERTGQLNPSVSTVAKDCGLSEKQARRYIHELVADGLVEADGNHRGGDPRTSKNYRLTFVDQGATPPTHGSPPQKLPLPSTGGDHSHPREGTPPAHGSLISKEPVMNQKEAQGKPALSAKQSKKKAELTFAAWYTQITEAGEKAISTYAPVLNFAEQVGLPLEWIDLAWQQFKRDHIARTDKQQADWRLTFLNYCRKGWLNVWKARRDGTFYLSDAGVMLAKELGVDVPNESQAQTPSLLAGCI